MLLTCCMAVNQQLVMLFTAEGFLRAHIKHAPGTADHVKLITICSAHIRLSPHNTVSSL